MIRIPQSPRTPEMRMNLKRWRVPTALAFRRVCKRSESAANEKKSRAIEQAFDRPLPKSSRFAGFQCSCLLFSKFTVYKASEGRRKKTGICSGVRIKRRHLGELYLLTESGGLRLCKRLISGNKSEVLTDFLGIASASAAKQSRGVVKSWEQTGNVFTSPLALFVSFYYATAKNDPAQVENI